MGHIMIAMKQSKFFSLIAVFCLFLSQDATAQTPDSGVGIGPIKELKLEDLSLDLAKKGKETFTAKCTACHKMSERYVGPQLSEVFKRRRPEWIMNMILNPSGMLENDSTAKELLGEFLVPMTFQNVSTDDVRGILEYFRYYAEKGEIAEAKAAKPPVKTDKKPKTKKKTK